MRDCYENFWGGKFINFHFGATSASIICGGVCEITAAVTETLEITRRDKDKSLIGIRDL